MMNHGQPGSVVTSSRQAVGRATIVSPPNRFERLACEDDLGQLTEEELCELQDRKVKTVFLEDATDSLIQTNNSPDLPFRYSVNPYRGCEHGCAYCYARPGHEYLGMNAGLDFETKILVKKQAADILRRELNRPGWNGDSITISGVTDCYQPAERVFRITRQLLEVFVESRQPFCIITKNALVVRDMEFLEQAAARNLVHVNLSLTTLDSQLARKLEPRTSSPAARLRAISRLREAAVPVGVMVSPIIPGLNDQEIPSILEAAASAGAGAVSSTLLRLPLSVKPVFLSWLAENLPDHCDRVLSRIRECRNGELSGSEFFDRMSGSGPYAKNIRQTVSIFAKKYGLDSGLPPLDRSQFRPPTSTHGQQWLF